ncbi:hypothetical protein ROZALSC1DRAFT_31156, partial [Rozella allomycis CSF55]
MPRTFKRLSDYFQTFHQDKRRTETRNYNPFVPKERNRATPEQYNELLKEFNKDPRPTHDDCDKIAKRFQNRRSKFRSPQVCKDNDMNTEPINVMENFVDFNTAIDTCGSLENALQVENSLVPCNDNAKDNEPMRPRTYSCPNMSHFNKPKKYEFHINSLRNRSQSLSLKKSERKKEAVKTCIEELQLSISQANANPKKKRETDIHSPVIAQWIHPVMPSA